MSDVVYAVGPCFGCGKPFHFNPHKVPSHRHNGVREPLCPDCMTLINTKRQQVGLEPFAIDPEAYEALPASEL